MHASRRVQYTYTKVDNIHSLDGAEHLLTRIEQPGRTTLEHTYHPILGEHHYRLLDTRFNGHLQEKIGACDDKPGTLEVVSHHEASVRYERSVTTTGACPPR